MQQYGQPNPQGQSVQQQMPPQQQAPEQPKVNPKEYYENLSKYAIKRVSENLGEEFDEYNPVHQAALADEVSTIKAQMYERNVAQQRLQAVYNKYSQDPNMAEIDRYAAQRLQQLPYSQAVKVQEALRNNNAQLIDAYMAACRDEYYRNRGFVPANEARPPRPAIPTPTVQKQKPPFVEATGASKQNPQQLEPKVDFAKLGGLTMEQQAQVASKFGLG
jgi:hypothetical protein